MANIKLWDLECSDLNANWGVILCGGVKTYGKKDTHVHTSKTPTNDKDVVRRIADDVADADAWVTWYGAGFDVPFLNSRLIFHGLNPLPPVPHIDGWKIARYKLKLNSNRLQSVRDFLGLPSDKTKVAGPIWLAAISGKKWAMKYIVDHCRADVEVLEQAYDRIKGLITPPVLNVATADGHPGCAICGANSKSLHAHGFGVTPAGNRWRRYQCQSCGGWNKGKVERVAMGKS